MLVAMHVGMHADMHGDKHGHSQPVGPGGVGSNGRKLARSPWALPYVAFRRNSNRVKPDILIFRRQFNATLACACSVMIPRGRGGRGMVYTRARSF